MQSLKQKYIQKYVIHFTYNSMLLLNIAMFFSFNTHAFFIQNAYAIELKDNFHNKFHNEFTQKIKPLLANKLPNTIFFDVNDKEHTLKNFINKLLIVCFWANWCANCTQELENLNNFYEQLKYNNITDVTIIIMSIDFKSNSRIIEVLKKYDIGTLEIFFDPHRALMMDMNVNSLPTTFFINDKDEVFGYSKEHLPWNDKSFQDSVLAMRDKNFQSIFKKEAGSDIKGKNKRQNDFTRKDSDDLLSLPTQKKITIIR